MPADYLVAVDWDDDGDYSGTGEDVSARTLARTDVTIRYGRDQARVLSPIAPGEAGLEIDNQSGDYSPESGSSPLAGNVLPGRGVLITGTLSSTDYILFRGHLDDYKLLPGRDRRSVALSCLDPLARLRGVRVTTDLHHSVQVGDAIGVVLDAAGWDADLRDLDQGATTCPWWWLDDEDAFDAITQLVDSEGPGSLLTVDTTGKIVFRSRHHRLTSAASVTSQATLRDSGAEPLYSAPLEYDHGWKDIVNVVSHAVPVRQLSGELSAVWQTSGLISISDGETVPVAARASSAFSGAVVPEAGTDYTLLSGVVSMTLSRTAGQSTTVYVTASGGPAVISDLQVRAYALETVSTRIVSAEETVSIGRYSRRGLPVGRDPVWAGVNDVVAIADLILAQRAERLPVISLTMRGANDTRLTQQLSRNLSDRVTVVNAELGLNGDCYIEQISHTISDAGEMHTTVFGLERVPTVASGLLILDDATLGKLDVGKLGGIGQSAASTVFILDDATQGQLGVGLLGY